jgi:hypothetical protein
MTKKNEYDSNFGQTDVRTCAYCDKTCNSEFFYPIVEKGTMFYSAISIFGGDSRKKINEGICLKCLLKGLFQICKSKENVDKYVELFLKDEIVEKL